MKEYLKEVEFSPSEPLPKVDEAVLRQNKLNHALSEDVLSEKVQKAYADFGANPNFSPNIEPALNSYKFQGKDLAGEIKSDFLKFDKAMLYSNRRFRGGGPSLAESMGIEVNEPEQVKCKGYVCVYINIGYLNSVETYGEMAKYMDTYCVNLRNVPEEYKVLWIPVRPPQESRIELVSFDELEKENKSWVSRLFTNIMRRLKKATTRKRKKS